MSYLSVIRGVDRASRSLSKMFGKYIHVVKEPLRKRKAERIDTSSRLAFSSWRGKYGLRKELEVVVNVESGDITNIVTPLFRGTMNNKGCYWVSNEIPRYSRGQNRKAFRAELRKGVGDAEGKYLAMLWEATKNPKACRLYYQTNYPRFDLADRIIGSVENTKRE